MHLDMSYIDIKVWFFPIIASSRRYKKYNLDKDNNAKKDVYHS